MTRSHHTHLQRLLSRARSRALAGHHDRAVRLIRALLRRHPDCADARLSLARILLLQGEAAAALSELDIADWYHQADQAPLSPAQQVRHLMVRGRSLRNLGNLNASSRVFEHVLQLHTHHRTAAMILADTYRELSQPRRALTLLEPIAARTPNDRQITHRLLDLYQALGRYDDALACLNQLDAQGRTSKRRALRRHRLLALAGRIPDAIEVGEALAAHARTTPAIHRDMAELSERIGDAPRAARHLAALDPQEHSTESLAALARLHTTAGRFAQAGRLWWRITRLDPTQHAATANLIVCAILEHRTELANRFRHHLQRALDTDTFQRTMAQAWTDVTPGRLWQQASPASSEAPSTGVLTGLLRDAAGVFERQSADHPAHADVHYHLAVCHEATGLRGAAAESLHRALHTNPGYIDAARLRARMLIQDGNLAAARALITATRNHKPNTQQLLDIELAVEVLTGNGTAANRRLADADLPEQQRTQILASVSHMLDRIDQSATWQPADASVDIPVAA